MWARLRTGSDEMNAAICVGAVMLVIVVFTKIAHAKWSDSSFSSDHIACAKALVAQAIEWHHFADQDDNPMFAVRHADYAVAYLNAARRLLPDDVLQRLTSIDIFETMVALEAHQQQRSRRLQKACPTINPNGNTSTVSWL